MSQAVDQEIRELRARFWSQRDPEGRAFAPLADAYRRKGDLDEALSLVEDGLARLPDFTSGQLVAARVFRAVDDAESARRALDRLLELDPRNTLGLLERAEVVGALGDRAAATGDLQTLLALEPGHLGARSLLDRLEAPPAVEPPTQPAAEPAIDVVPPEPEPESTAEPLDPDTDPADEPRFIDPESGWEEFAREPTRLEEEDATSDDLHPLEIDVDSGLPALEGASEDDVGFVDMGDFDLEEFPTADLDESSSMSGEPATPEPGEEEVADEFGLDAFTADIQPGGWDAYEGEPEDTTDAPEDPTGELSATRPSTPSELDRDSLAPSLDDPAESAEDDDLPYVDLPYLDGTEVSDGVEVSEGVEISEGEEVEAGAEEASAPTREPSTDQVTPEVQAWEPEVPAEIVPEGSGLDVSEPDLDLGSAEVVEVESEPADMEPREEEPEPASTGSMEWDVEVVPDSPQLMTRTMAEIFVQQGLTARAVNVYESLVDRNTSDDQLRQRLEELRVRLAEEDAAEPPLDESAPQWVTSPTDEEERATPFAWDPEEGDEAVATGEREGADDTDVEEAGRPIGRLFDDLLSWEPGAVPIGYLAPEAAPELAPAESALARALASGAPLPGREPERKEPAHHGEAESASPPVVSAGAGSPPSDTPGPPGTSEAAGSEDLDDLDDFRSWLKSLDP